MRVQRALKPNLGLRVLPEPLVVGIWLEGQVQALRLAPAWASESQELVSLENLTDFTILSSCPSSRSPPLS